jgi:3-dehydrotetronate 4-kinase
MSKIILGCVADDFSGASDAASFFVKEGVKTFLFNGIPKDDIKDSSEYIAVVIALKTRTQETSQAVLDTLEAMEWLKKNGANQLFVKYCSTFDSTKTGNIGPIIDSILEKYNIKYTILCPALPVNGRTVVNGHLYVNGVPLNETHMKDHPLTPMWASDIVKLMEPQGKYPCLKVNYKMLEQSKEEILKMIDDFGRDKEHFYVIPDYIEEKHSIKIVDVFGDLQLLTGGSGLMSQLGRKYIDVISSKADIPSSYTTGKAIILAGSCSKATLEQIQDFKNTGRKYIKINPAGLMNGSQTKEEIWKYVKSIKEDAVLVYSSDNTENVREAQKAGSQVVSDLLEQTTAYLAKKAVETGFNRIIVAGGETSGAVTRILGYDSYLVGESIAPGVPVMIPLNNKNIRLVLKSGNFGQRDFFKRAINITKEVKELND